MPKKTSKRGRKTSKGRKSSKKRSSTAVRVGSVVTRKLSPATMKKYGVKLKAIGKRDGKTAYKVMRAKKSVARGKKTRWRDTREGKRVIAENRAFAAGLARESDKKIKPGAIMVAPEGVTMRWVKFYRVDRRDGDRVTMTGIGKKQTWGDSQNGTVMPDTSKTDNFQVHGRVDGGLVRVGRMRAHPWSGRPESEYGD